MAIPYIIARDAPSSVVYDLSVPDQATITLPTGSTWNSGLHWHETHTEYLRVVKGRVRVRLGNTVRIVSAADGELCVDRYVWHEWSRASPDGEEVVVVERTDPADGEKAIFFWNLNAVILNAQKIRKPFFVPGWLFGLLMDAWISLNLFVIFDGLDNLPVFLGIADVVSQCGLTVTEGTAIWHVLATLERLWAHLVLGTATRLGWFLRVQAVRPSYTPPGEYRQWALRKKEGKTQ